MVVAQQIDVVFQPDEFGRQAKGILDQEGLIDRLSGWPDEKDQRDDDLRGHQKVRQRGCREMDALEHLTSGGRNKGKDRDDPAARVSGRAMDVP